MKYEPVIGMEVHAELKTKSKMFCDSINGFGLEKEPNVHICPVCTGQPGTLPVINEEAVKMVIKAGLALNCQIAEDSFFERKNYFYPDLPKGYQISQYQKPLCFKGWLEINDPVILAEAGIQDAKAEKNTNMDSRLRGDGNGEDGNGNGEDGNGNGEDGNGNDGARSIRITRIHLEEDTGKLTHPKGADYSLVDFNRAGVPLMELVTEPDMRSGEEAKKFCQELQLILRYLGISDADMEKGQMRCEVNISLREIAGKTQMNKRIDDEDNLLPERSEAESKADMNNPSTSSGNNIMGTKVEIKNLNSFRVVQKAIDYEIKRQAELLNNDEKVVQETRGWDDNKGITFSQRVKEEAHDYRYFPEPDLPPLTNLHRYLPELKAGIFELPQQKRERLAKEYGLPKDDVEVFVYDKDLADYFEQVCSELMKTEYSDSVCHPDPALNAGEESYQQGDSSALPQNDKKECEDVLKKLYKLTANYLLTEIPRIADRLKIAAHTLDERIAAENFAEFIVMTYKGVISSSGAQAVLEEMFKTGADPSHIIESKNLAQVSDAETLEKIVEDVIKNNPQPVEDYKKGKEASLQFLVGQIMKETKGKANPKVVQEILKEKLK